MARIITYLAKYIFLKNSMMVLTFGAKTGLKSRCDPIDCILVTSRKASNYTGEKKTVT